MSFSIELRVDEEGVVTVVSPENVKSQFDAGLIPAGNYAIRGHNPHGPSDWGQSISVDSPLGSAHSNTIYPKRKNETLSEV